MATDATFAERIDAALTPGPGEALPAGLAAAWERETGTTLADPRYLGGSQWRLTALREGVPCGLLFIYRTSRRAIFRREGPARSEGLGLTAAERSGVASVERLMGEVGA